ncbi:MAG TPA: MarR family transcriptional regulator [Candidatus Dormibacteraeota bacterium]|nr:MarR family transcriptional regulator [Candidatus Dormibacteraeota bacterium]
MGLKNAEVAVRAGAIQGIEFELALLARGMEQVVRRTDLYEGMDRAGYTLLVCMEEEEGPVTANRLALRLGLDDSTVTRQVNRLVRQGLVSRGSDPDDRRSSLLTATAEGHRRTAQLRDRRRERLAAVLSDRESEELEDIRHHIELLNELIRRTVDESGQSRP